MPTIESCGDCYFWRVVRDNHQGRHGTCHAKAPQGPVTKGKDTYYPFAITNRTDFCGDFEKSEVTSFSPQK